MRTSLDTAGACPTPPARRATTYSRTLHRACLVLGGEKNLARYLAVEEAEVLDWLQARADPPEAVFLAALETVLDHPQATVRN